MDVSFIKGNTSYGYDALLLEKSQLSPIIRNFPNLGKAVRLIGAELLPLRASLVEGPDLAEVHEDWQDTKLAKQKKYLGWGRFTRELGPSWGQEDSSGQRARCPEGMKESICLEEYGTFGT